MASADSARPQRIRLRLRAIIPRAPARGPTSQRARGQPGNLNFKNRVPGPYRIAFGPRRAESVHGARHGAARRRVHPDAVCRRTGFQPARGGALRRRQSQAARTAVALHHSPSAGQRTRAMQRRWTGGAQAQDRVARRQHSPRDVAGGSHAAVGCAGAAGKAAPSGSMACWCCPLPIRPSCGPWWCRTGPKRSPASRSLQQPSQAARTV